MIRDRKIVTAALILATLLWLPFAFRLSRDHLAYAGRILDAFAGKSQEEKIRDVTQDLQPSFDAVRNGTEERSRILIQAQRFRQGYRFEYYLYPRVILLMEGGSPAEARSFCLEHGIDYLVTYARNNRPVLERID